MQLVKRFVCPGCGASGPVPSRTPFLHCDYCATTADYDWGVARAHAEWPAHEARVHALYAVAQPRLDAAARAFDQLAWLACYRDILVELVRHHPTLYPLRVVEPAYRAHFIEFEAAHRARLATDRQFVERQRDIAVRSQRVVWHGERAALASLIAVVDVAVAFFDDQDRRGRDEPPGFPPDFAPGYMRQVGASMTAQEWMRFLSLADQRGLVDHLGIGHQYIDPEGAAATCRGCGAEVFVVAGDQHATCPFCHAAFFEVKAGLLPRGKLHGDFAAIDRELAIAEADAGKRTLDGLELLDGPSTCTGSTLQLVTLRARFGRRVDAVWEACGGGDGTAVADARAWAAATSEARGVPLRTLAYREHPRCAQLPANAAELARRLADVALDAVPAQVRTATFMRGLTYEVEVGDAVVRLAIDRDGKITAFAQRWIHGRS